jgi:hypothetical protein
MTWWAIFQGLCLVLVTVAGVYIAWRQHKTARAKLQLDLYDKRYGVFQAVKRLLAEVGRTGTASLETMIDFDQGTADADFMFGDEVTTYIAIMRARGFKLHQYGNVVADMRHPNRARAIDAQANELLWFMQQYNEMRGVFRPFMTLDERAVRTLPRWSGRKVY